MRIAPHLALLAALSAGPAFAQAENGQPFRVFFDWAKPELTRDAQAILDEAIAAYQQTKPRRVMVSAHTDRSGSAAYNLAASRRRGEAVRAYLATHGMPAGSIVVSAYGETRPIVATEDGVREAQNRRVEISFERPAPRVPTIVPLVGADGSAAGSASLASNSLSIEATGLPPGELGLHVHTVGRCEGPDFASAGPHWNPTRRQHGRDNPEGPHLGDLPNLIATAEGRGTVVLALPPGFLDADGASIVIHASPDDYRTDPSGNSGARIACAAFIP